MSLSAPTTPYNAWKRTLLQAAGTLVLAVIGSLIARTIQLPLPWMMGAMLATTIAALFKLEVAGLGVKLPVTLRMIVVPVIGVMLGSSFSPAMVGQMVHWWWTLAGLFVFVGGSLLIIYNIYRRYFGFDMPTAYFAAIPGGVIESAILGEMAGGDSRTISLIHFCRVLMAVLTIPIALRMIYGPIGSVAIPAGSLDTALSPLDILLLVLAGFLGYAGALRLKVPGAAITGPMIMSAIIHLAGFTAASPPSWLVITAQVIMGASLGSRFAGYTIMQAYHAIKAAIIGVAVMISMAMAVGLALLPVAGESFTAMILSYAPGGLAEMSLIALSLNIGVAFVATHHIARICITMMGAPAIYKMFFDKNVKLTT